MQQPEKSRQRCCKNVAVLSKDAVAVQRTERASVTATRHAAVQHPLSRKVAALRRRSHESGSQLACSVILQSALTANSSALLKASVLKNCMAASTV